MLKNLCEMPICGFASHHAGRIKDHIKPSLKFHSKQDGHFIYTHEAMSYYECVCDNLSCTLLGLKFEFTNILDTLAISISLGYNNVFQNLQIQPMCPSFY
jgi:hypothetical protein